MGMPCLKLKVDRTGSGSVIKCSDYIYCYGDNYRETGSGRDYME